MALSSSQITQIRALAATGLAPDVIAAQVGVEIGDVQSAIGGGLSSGDVGGDGEVSVARRVTKRIPSAWILANATPREGVAFEIVAGMPGVALLPFAAVTVLRFNSVPYQGRGDLQLFIGTDPVFAEVVLTSPAPLASGFWDATRNVSAAFGDYDLRQRDTTGLPLSFGLYGENDPLTDGDSDLDVTVFYVTAST